MKKLHFYLVDTNFRCYVTCDLLMLCCRWQMVDRQWHYWRCHKLAYSLNVHGYGYVWLRLRLKKIKIKKIKIPMLCRWRTADFVIETHTHMRIAYCCWFNLRWVLTGSREAVVLFQATPLNGWISFESCWALPAPLLCYSCVQINYYYIE